MSYLDRNFKAQLVQEQRLIEEVVYTYDLQHNEEQERAFRIVANHKTQSLSKQLSMVRVPGCVYLIGGMGGTGKSQIIKALKHFFEKRGKGSRFAILAPTGTAAAGLNGSTYHSFLSVDWKNNKSGIENAQANLIGVEYIFLDEISMVSCFDMYCICECLSQCTSCHLK
ncbi:hypothetical protein C8J56DRAFT_785006 [Mycena floridula]|nr:hypothetical protein C8J56DRAFT_785006 [Mycena floridula]